MKYQMMLKILFLLLSRKKVSAKYIADRYDLSLRTVYRYIDELCLADIPIYNIRGRNGGYAISDTYKIPASFLTAEEFDRVIATLGQINNELGSNVLETAISKLGSISKTNDLNLSIDFGNLVIDGTAWGTIGLYTETLKLLQRAIEENLAVKISYRDREGKISLRIIEPHTLALKQGLWYCYSYCRLRNEFRLFKVGRIEKAQVLQEKFERRHIENISEVLSTWYEEQPDDVDLIIEPSIKADVEEWLGVDKITTLKNGSITASAKLPICDYITAKILSFGDKIKVVAPEKLKKAIIEKASAVQNLYR